MKQHKIAIIAVIIGVALLLGGFLLMRKNAPLTEQTAIEAIKQKYAELKDYPSDKLPPRSITAAQSGDKWYVAFVQNGSGTPIVEARCFMVNPDYSVAENGTFKPEQGSMTQSISPVTCAAQ